MGNDCFCRLRQPLETLRACCGMSGSIVPVKFQESMGLVTASRPIVFLPQMAPNERS